MSLNAVNTIASEYYGVHSTSIEWLSNMIFLMYAVLCVPLTFIINRFGVKPILVLAAFCDVASALLNYIGHDCSKFRFLVIGQMFNGFALSCILQMPAKVAASWFRDKERATATSISVMSVLVGVAVGYLHPALTIKPGASTNADIKRFFFIVMIETIAILVVTLFYQEAPPTAPSASAHVREELPFTDALWLLIKNKNYILLSTTFCIVIGLSIAISVLLDPIVSSYFPKETVGIGTMGFSNYVSTIPSFIAVGKILDKYRKYRTTASILTVGSCILWTTFVVVLTESNTFIAVYVIFVILGLFMQPFQSVGIEQAAEMTYPVSEEISTVVMVMLADGFGFIIVLVFGFIIQAGYVKAVAYAIGCLYFIAFVLTLCTTTELKRLQADKKGY